MKLLASLCLALALVACQGVGVTVPESDGKPVLSATEKRLADGYVTLISVRRSIRDMVSRGAITSQEAAEMNAQANSVRQNLDAAVVLSGSAQDSRVQLALTALLALEARLKAKEAK